MEHTHATPQANVGTLPEIISDDFLALLRESGVKRAALFGSFAFGSAGPESDIDLLVEFIGTVHLFDQIGLADRLSLLCGRRVDLMVNIEPAFVPYILPTLLPLPL